ncbi:pirin family protein [Acetobacter thailandicus]|uniref:pirin family protein n=1 Tax=Acetobacter thailandicus TaxID=1502842 RepID=UPI001BA8DF8E|nr:pirin-like C-terminal cupin domain-containing protein [Acetobacter thailandicus]MBS1004513.1 pirin family protein [Acetobacter thailandicus]
MTMRSIARKGAAVKRPGSWEFQAANTSSRSVGTDIDPIITIDHFHIRTPQFPPHPHAGFSALTYLFEESEGPFMSRDSRGNTHVSRPGGFIWTVAASGVIHEEFPLEEGKLSHGLQVFVNLSAEEKKKAPQSLFVDGPDIPVVERDGVRVRIASGNHGGVSAAIAPPGDITFLEVQLQAGSRFEHPLPADQRALVYVIDGSVQVAGQELGALEAASLAQNGDTIVIDAQAPARVVVIAGPPLREPLVQHGPFAMNSEADINAAIERYHRGEMGRLEPFDTNNKEHHA